MSSVRTPPTEGSLLRTEHPCAKTNPRGRCVRVIRTGAANELECQYKTVLYICQYTKKWLMKAAGGTPAADQKRNGKRIHCWQCAHPVGHAQSLPGPFRFSGQKHPA